MDPEIHGSEHPSSYARKEPASKDSVDEQIKERAYAMSLSTDVNMVNCYKHCKHFFKRCNRIHFDVLIAYWMMAGYLGPADSIDEAYKKGHGFLLSLIQEGILKALDDDGEVVELATSRKSSNPVQCKHQRLCVSENLGFADVLDLGKIENIVLTEGAVEKRKGAVNGDYLSRQVHHSLMGLKYLAHFNPRPNFLKLLLENVQQLSVLILRGYDGLLPLGNFPFEKFRALTVLEINGPSHLTAIPTSTISQMTQLQCLNLSNLLIEALPHGFFSRLLQLHWLILRGCLKLRYLPLINHLEKLEVLDLSYTGLFMVPSLGENIPLLYAPPTCLPELLPPPQDAPLKPCCNHLRYLILQGCTNLVELPEMGRLKNLEVLDISGCKQVFSLPRYLCNLKKLEVLNLSGCSCLRNFSVGIFDQLSSLLKLDLSGTRIKRLPSFANLTSLRTLSLRGLELHYLDDNLSYLSNLIELNLSGVKISFSRVFTLDFLDSLEHLQILDISQTSVEKLPNLPKLKSLTKLLLANCQNLKVLPDLQPLTNLEVLDLSLPDDSTVKDCQFEIETDAEGQKCPTLLAPSSLRKLVLTNRSSVQKLYSPASPGNMEFLTVPSDRNGNLQEGHAQGEGQISGAAEIHIVSSIRNQLSWFDQFIQEFRNLDARILCIQENFASAMAVPATANTSNQPFEKQFKTIHADLTYIQENIELLQGSRNCKSIEELLQELMEVIAQLSSTDSSADLVDLKQLIRVVVKLKLLFPPKQAIDQASSKVTSNKKQSSNTRTMNMENATLDIVEEFSSLECHQQERANLLRSCYHQSLTDIQKYCLLSFSTFPCNEHEDTNTGVKKSLVIKKKILFFLWAGEGIVDLYREGTAAATADMPHAIEDTCKQILKVLTDKGFIEPVMKKHRESTSCRMLHFVHSFVTAMAKEMGFFYFNKQNSRLTPYFTRSRRDHSLNFQVNYMNSHKEVESLSDVLTLVNSNESDVYIKREWLSKMKHLSVLYLGSWHSENAKHIEVVDEMFLKDLKEMKQLRLLSLQGLSTIKKLPDSICKLANLKILDLRECSYLEELPANIGSLKALTHLDITNCRFLTKLPKGIGLLSKLEVLKGFVISHQGGDSCAQKANILNRSWKNAKRCVIHGLFRCKNDDVCTLGDLVKVEKLRELSLVVNTIGFPDMRDSMLFSQMRGLRKLKIVWERNIMFDYPRFGRGMIREMEEWNCALNEDVTKPSRWHGMKCLENQSSQNNMEETSTSPGRYLDHIEKLELWCFPHRNIPHWIDCQDMKNLNTLYIIGGSLEIFPFHGVDNATTLRLKYLDKIDISWSELKTKFPRLKDLECHECKLLRDFPCGKDGVWNSSLPPLKKRLELKPNTNI